MHPRQLRAVVGSAAFFAVAPGVIAGIIPWSLTGWQMRDVPSWWLPLQLVGALALCAGAAVLVQAFARFVSEGIGTPAPIVPTENLVVGGWYRYVRNPMYLAVAATIVGQALLLRRLELVAYLVVFGAAVFAFVRLYEEPTLRQRFGREYEDYMEHVPAWWPRRRPWRPSGGR